MNNKYVISIIAIIIMMITIISPFIGFRQMEIAKANPGTLGHTATITPQLTTLPTLPYTQTYSINVTSTGTDYLNKTCIKLPEGWTNTTVTPPTNWTVTAADGKWINFTWHDTYYTDCDFKNGKSYVFDIPATISMIPPTTGTWYVYAYSGTNASANNPVTLTVTVKLQFSSTMTPNYVRNGTAYIYTLTTTNDESAVGINKINITFPGPTAWSFNQLVDYTPRTWTVSFDSATSTFMLSGPNILDGVIKESVVIKVNMTVPSSATARIYYWNTTTWDANGNYLGKYSMKAVIDSSKPTVTFNQPTVAYYKVGSGNYIWINITVTDTPSIEEYGITVSINDSRFQHASTFSEKISSTQYKYFYVNNTAIPDGTLAVKVTATDPAGNIGSKTTSTIIDNTKPEKLWVKVLDQSGNELPFVNGVYWMGAGTTGIKVNASFSNPSGASGYIYLNTTQYAFNNHTETALYDVTVASYVTLKITLVDGATPLPHNNFTKTWPIKRDNIPPNQPTFTIESICGGAVIRALNATDGNNVGILNYKVYVNGTSFSVTPSELNSLTLTSIATIHRTFAGVLVLNLTDYSGKVANITISAVDYGSNEGPSKTVTCSIPEGRWYPIELWSKWNLISLPLIPNSTATSDIYSLILNQGATGVTVTYGFSNTAKSWVINPTTMTDGTGYWIYMKAYDVLIVQGLKTPAPPATPTTYHLPKGWNLVGYTEICTMNASAYVESLETNSYFRWLYIWNAEGQYWSMIDTNPSTSGTLSPGQAFWIYLYIDQDLVPPIC